MSSPRTGASGLRKGCGRLLESAETQASRAFPPEFCRQLVVHAKLQGISEGNTSKLMEFLNEEVEGVLIPQKIRGEPMDATTYTPSATALHVNSKQLRPGRKDRRKDEPFCVLRGEGSLGPRMQYCDYSV